MASAIEITIDHDEDERPRTPRAPRIARAKGGPAFNAEELRKAAREAHIPAFDLIEHDMQLVLLRRDHAAYDSLRSFFVDDLHSNLRRHITSANELFQLFLLGVILCVEMGYERSELIKLYDDVSRMFFKNFGGLPANEDAAKLEEFEYLDKARAEHDGDRRDEFFMLSHITAIRAYLRVFDRDAFHYRATNDILPVTAHGVRRLWSEQAKQREFIERHVKSPPPSPPAASAASRIPLTPAEHVLAERRARRENVVAATREHPEEEQMGKTSIHKPPPQPHASAAARAGVAKRLAAGKAAKPPTSGQAARGLLLPSPAAITRRAALRRRQRLASNQAAQAAFVRKVVANQAALESGQMSLCSRDEIFRSPCLKSRDVEG